MINLYRLAMFSSCLSWLAVLTSGFCRAKFSQFFFNFPSAFFFFFRSFSNVRRSAADECLTRHKIPRKKLKKSSIFKSWEISYQFCSRLEFSSLKFCDRGRWMRRGLLLLGLCFRFRLLAVPPLQPETKDSFFIRDTDIL